MVAERGPGSQDTMRLDFAVRAYYATFELSALSDPGALQDDAVGQRGALTDLAVGAHDHASGQSDEIADLRARADHGFPVERDILAQLHSGAHPALAVLMASGGEVQPAFQH